MATCDITKSASSACSGKCRGESCGSSALWVLATCKGEIALFQKQGDRLTPCVFPQRETTADTIRDHLLSASDSGMFQQLVIIGSNEDISLLRHHLPGDAARRIIAEIEYPLTSSWFEAGGQKLSEAIIHLM